MAGDRITVRADQCGGRPCIRGMRIRVEDVVGMVRAGESRETILKFFPYLESEDIDAALEYEKGGHNGGTGPGSDEGVKGG